MTYITINQPLNKNNSANAFYIQDENQKTFPSFYFAKKIMKKNYGNVQLNIFSVDLRPELSQTKSVHNGLQHK